MKTIKIALIQMCVARYVQSN